MRREMDGGAPRQNKRYRRAAAGVGISALILAGCSSGEGGGSVSATTPGPSSPSVSETSTPGFETSTPGVEPWTVQIPVARWRADVSPTDHTLPKDLAQGARITSFTPVTDGTPGRPIPDTSAVSAGELFPVEEKKPFAFDTVQIDGTVTDSTQLKGRDYWIYGGGVDRGQTSYSVQNDSQEPCAVVAKDIFCQGTYTSNHAGVGDERGLRRYMLASAPIGDRKRMAELVEAGTNFTISEMPKGVVIHDVVDFQRLPTKPSK